MTELTATEARAHEARLRVEAARDLLNHVLDDRVELDVAAIGVRELLKQAREFEAA